MVPFDSGISEDGQPIGNRGDWLAFPPKFVATVNEKPSQIQKVSAQLEASKPAPQVVNNP